ncbi:NAD-dependent epimerase/dehydratase family protein [Myxococcota bacterium]
MRTVVTGGAGFIGSHIADALVAMGCEVLVIDDLSTGKRENVPDAASFALVSITSSEVERIIGDFRPGAVFHLAAQMDVRRSVADPVFDARTNIEGTVRVVSAAARSGVEKIFFASTGGAIYGEQETFPAAEDHPIRGESPYGVSKRCAELYLDYFSRTSRMRAVLLRFANVYGPRQDPHGEAGVVAIFCEKMLANQTPTINGDGEQTRDYVYVEDVVRANLLALRHDAARGPINIGTGVETSVKELAGGLAAAAGYDGEIQYGPAQPGEQRRSVLDIRRAAEVLHWEPQTGLTEGLQKTAAWFRER